VEITDEIIGISQLLGGTCPGCPKSLCLCHNTWVCTQICIWQFI